MVKTVSLPEMVYSELVSIAGELTMRAKKPISLGMTLSFLTAIYRAMVETYPGLPEKIAEKLQTIDVMSPEEFEKTWDSVYKKITGEG